jgi:hypothetical protein
VPVSAVLQVFTSSISDTITITRHTCTTGYLEAQREQIGDQLKVLHRRPSSRETYCWNDSNRYHRLQPRYPDKGLTEESTMITCCLCICEESRLARLIESSRLGHSPSRQIANFQSLCAKTVSIPSLLAMPRSSRTSETNCA